MDDTQYWREYLDRLTVAIQKAKAAAKRAGATCYTTRTEYSPALVAFSTDDEGRWYRKMFYFDGEESAWSECKQPADADIYNREL